MKFAMACSPADDSSGIMIWYLLNTSNHIRLSHLGVQPAVGRYGDCRYEIIGVDEI